MRTVEIIGYKRANLGKSESKRLRETGHAPCVLYGGKEQVHFYTPMILFRDIVYKPEPAFVKLNIEGDIYHAIMQDIQFHPVNEIIYHVDFLELSDDRMIKMDIPLAFEGVSPGVIQGGKLTVKLRSVPVKAYPKNMPEKITLDITSLDLGKSLRVSAIVPDNYEVLGDRRITVATVEVPRTLKGTETEAAQ